MRHRINHGPRCVALALFTLISSLANAQEAEWIWSPRHEKDQVPQVACHFRKTIRLTNPEEAELTIGADDRYDLYVNGRRIGSGGSSRELDEYDITRYLGRGFNTIAVRVANRNGSTAALAVRVAIKEQGGEWISYSTDGTWVTQLNPLPLWNTNLYNDRRWTKAQSFGRLGDTAPWDIEEGIAAEERTNATRFNVVKGFRVQRLLDETKTGSLIAMTFNEFGHIIASKGGGPLLLIFDSDEDGVPDKVKTYCDKVKNCQGILALNGDVFVTADGPDGPALYRLKDEDRDGTLESITTLVEFTGDSMGEHGPHGITLGPDGLLYIAMGNHSSIKGDFDESSPHSNYYAGDLLKPRYEDPGGHARGVTVPGGTVIRTDIRGASVHLVAGGLRNAYDLAFNQQGDLFTFDSDMESDIGTSWYRPTNIYQIVDGGEYGWRSGWAKWPSYYIDSLPPLADAGRGSPTGITSYNHVMFPTKYHNAMFMADWSEGRILAVRTKRQGASYTASVEEFLSGQPLNVTDLEVGPDGAIYFVTGGRTTRGGLYRVSWSGEVPEEFREFGDGITAVIRTPQLQSAWTRQKIAGLKRKIGKDWTKLLVGVARDTANPSPYRTRALDVLQLFGPPPKTDLLIELSKEKSEAIRSKAAELMGVQSDEKTGVALVSLLDDSDRTVRRKACEALSRAGQTAPVKKILKLLGSDDRAESWAARQLLEKADVDTWREEILDSENHRVFVQGSLALIITDPSRLNAAAITERFHKHVEDFVSDRDFVDMLRLMQIVLEKGGLEVAEIPKLRDALAEEFPAGDSHMNRELIRLLAYLQADAILPRVLDYLDTDAPLVDRLHVALHLRFIEDGWTSKQKLRLIEFLEETKNDEAGNSTPLYIRNVVSDFSKGLSVEDARLVLANGHRWPAAAVGSLYRLPKELDEAMIEDLIELDNKLADKNDVHFNRLKVGIVAMLSTSGDAKSLKHLRLIWMNDPERRNVVAVGLAQHPNDENWSYLVRSLNKLQGNIAKEVLIKLLEIEKAPAEPEYYRQVILAGLRLQDDGAIHAVNLLEYWTGETFVADEQQWEASIQACQEWFHKTHPDQLEAKLPEVSADAKYQLDELLKHLTSDAADKVSPERGHAVFAKADCSKCHRFGSEGESMGPDLTSLRKRFTRREVLESVLFPSHAISDQYAAKNLVLNDGQKYSGLVTSGGEGELILLNAKGEKLSILEKDIDEITPSRLSSMPSGLLDKLTLEEIADLVAYLMKTPNPEVARRISDD